MNSPIQLHLSQHVPFDTVGTSTLRLPSKSDYYNSDSLSNWYKNDFKTLDIEILIESIKDFI